MAARGSKQGNHLAYECAAYLASKKVHLKAESNFSIQIVQRERLFKLVNGWTMPVHGMAKATSTAHILTFLK